MAPRYTVPPRNNAYVAMLGLAVGGMVFAILLLALELNGYDTATPPAFQAVSLPKVEPRPATPAAPAPPSAPGGQALAEPAAPAVPTAPPPAPLAITPPPLPAPPAVAAAEPPKVDPPKAEDPAKRGPRPGFNLAVPGQQPK
jgi:type IV secretory pathway VirB10-like protein